MKITRAADEPNELGYQSSSVDSAYSTHSPITQSISSTVLKQNSSFDLKCKNAPTSRVKVKGEMVSTLSSGIQLPVAKSTT